MEETKKTRKCECCGKELPESEFIQRHFGASRICKHCNALHIAQAKERKRQVATMESDLCKYSIDNGFEICLSKEDGYGCIMAIKQDKNSEDGAEWWVLAIITNEQDVEILASWLPNYVELVKKYYELKLKNKYKL